jgi:indolepyruvate ferredoxin oxidoreductase
VALLGNSIGSNIFLLGYAYQRGAIPLGAAAIEEAITLNGEAVDMNIAAFRWGRRAAVDPKAVEAVVTTNTPSQAKGSLKLSESLDEVIERRAAFLQAYQSKRYARRFHRRIEEVRGFEAEKVPGSTALTEAVARYLFKLMAYKDEYEVARLLSDDRFDEAIRKQFDGEKLEIRYQLAPPLLARKNPETGEPKKMEFGPWMRTVFKLLKRFRFLRGTFLDPFGHTEERRTERQLIADYNALLDEVLAGLTPDKHALAVGLASIPEKIRGYGHVKMRHLKPAKAEEANLLEQFRASPEPMLKAAE